MRCHKKAYSSIIMQISRTFISIRIKTCWSLLHFVWLNVFSSLYLQLLFRPMRWICKIRIIFASATLDVHIVANHDLLYVWKAKFYFSSCSCYTSMCPYYHQHHAYVNVLFNYPQIFQQNGINLTVNSTNKRKYFCTNTNKHSRWYSRIGINSKRINAIICCMRT